MKDYNHNGHVAPPDSPQSRDNDIRAQFLMSDAVRLSTLSTMLHRAEAKIAILEYTVKVYETHPLLVAYDALQATGCAVTFVGELRSGDAGRIQASGELLTVVEALVARWRMAQGQVIDIGKLVEERKVG